MDNKEKKELKKKEELIEEIKSIDTIEDEVARRTKLAELTNEVSTIYDTYSGLEEESHKLKEDNEKLRKANMDLFLQVGTQTKSVEETVKERTGIEEEKEPERKKFEDLFNEKGELK